MAEQQNEQQQHGFVQQNLREITATDATALNVKSITNIYYDCLEHIFDRLDFGDFLNLAQTCKRLQIAALAHFAEKFKKGATLNVQDFFAENGPTYLVSEGYLIAEGWKSCLPLLRCFGSKILSLCVDYDFAEKRECDFVDGYINQFCASSLKSIVFYEKKEFSAESFRVPFKNVVAVSVDRGNLNKNLPNFVKWFPNLRELTMRRISIDESTMAVKLPYLELLHIVLLALEQPGVLSMKNAVNFLRANQQIENFCINASDITLSKLLPMINDNTTILILEIGNNPQGIVNFVAKRAEMIQFAEKHQPLVELILYRCRMSADDAVFFIRQLKSLREFLCEVADPSELNRILQQLGNEWRCIWTNSLESGELIIVLNR